MFFYALALIFFIIPVTLRAYLSLKNGKHPLPYFQNNWVVSRIKMRKAIGVLSPILFWVFHAFYVIASFVDGAWLASLAAVVYMVLSAMLTGQIKSKEIGVIPESASPAPTEQ